MKIRTGFVSNSSSSSFLIGFKEKPKSMTQLMDILFPSRGREIPEPVTSYLCEMDAKYKPVSARTAAKRIFDQIKYQNPMSEKKILEEMLRGVIEGVTDNDESILAGRNIPVESLREEMYKNLPNYLKFRYNFFRKTGVDIEKINYDQALKKKDLLEAYNKYKRLVYSYLYEVKLKRIRELLEKYKANEFKDKKIFVVEFADDIGDPVEAILEHGNTFNNIPHIKVNKH